jgi:hypothetical protein
VRELRDAFALVLAPALDFKQLPDLVDYQGSE